MKKPNKIKGIIDYGVSGPPGVPGFPGIIGYCPKCGEFDFQTSVTSSSVLIICYCGWCDTVDQLLTKQQFQIKQRKDKLLKIKNYEN